MKKNKPGLMALALTAGIAGAFANVAKQQELAAGQTEYFYQPVSGIPPQNGGSTFTGTQAAAQDFYGCDSFVRLCAKAYNVSNHSQRESAADVHRAD
jgi:hypothetical protein